MAKLWKQPRCPTTDKWIKKMWHLYTMEFYPATKKDEILSVTGKRMELENIILSKIASEGQKSRFPSYEDYSPKINAVILLDMGHTVKGDRALKRQGKGKK
jgi:hypothetical protein